MLSRTALVKCEFSDGPATLRLRLRRPKAGLVQICISLWTAVPEARVSFWLWSTAEDVRSFSRELMEVYDKLEGQAVMGDADGAIILVVRVADRGAGLLETSGGLSLPAFDSCRGGSLAKPLGEGLTAKFSDFFFDQTRLPALIKSLESFLNECAKRAG